MKLQPDKSDVQTINGDKMLKDTYRITLEDIQATLKWEKVKGIEPGDVVLIRTGWDNLADDPFFPSYGTPPVLAKLIEQGALGQKSGAGFYKKVGKDILRLDPAKGEYVPAGGKAEPIVERMLKKPAPEQRTAIEDCIARNFFQAYCFTSGTGIPGGAYWNDVTVRRCTALDSNGGHGQGLFADAYGGQLTLEDVTLINCGTNDSQSHCVYIDKAVATASTPIITRVLCWPNYPTTANVSTTSEGVKSRQGAIMSDCHMAWCAIGFAIGTTDGDGSNDFVVLGTVQAKIDNCIVTNACGLTTAGAYGYGAWLLGIEGTGNYMRNCGFVNTLSTSSDRAWLTLIRWNAAATGGQIDNLSMSGNVAYNAGKFVVADLPTNYSNLVFSNNKIRVTDTFAPLIEHYQNTSQNSIFTERQNNSLWSGAATGSWVSAPANGNLTAYGASSAGSAGAGLTAPTRNYTGYLATKSVTVANESAAHAHIRTQLIAQRRYAWNADYTPTAFNDWYRVGLGIDPIGGVVTPAVTAPSYYLETIGAR